MKLDRRLNLVIPIELGETAKAYVHSMPITQDVFEQYFWTLSKTFTAIYNGMGIISGPRVAAMVLKRIAIQEGEWTGDSGIENGLMNEIRRRTNVLMAGPKGWETLPFQEAKDTGKLDPQDCAEVENALVFFTVASSIHQKKDLPAIWEGLKMYWAAETSSLDCTAYATF